MRILYILIYISYIYSMLTIYSTYLFTENPTLFGPREVVNFFKAHKISTAVAAHFTNAGCGR